MGIRNNVIEKVETATVQDNKLLAIGADRSDIERSKKAIESYGLLTLPVVGKLPGGGNMVLSGECEYLAMREMGEKKMDAVTVEITEGGNGDSLVLLLAALRKSPNALCEGMLIKRALESGEACQAQIGEMLGKSASWVSKRIALACRLNKGVQELLMQRQLSPHSAQEIARLPGEVQHGFAVKAIEEGLPKSAIEALVVGYNSEGCPDEVKAQIVGKPRDALKRLTGKTSAVCSRIGGGIAWHAQMPPDAYARPNASATGTGMGYAAANSASRPAQGSCCAPSSLKEAIEQIRPYCSHFCRHLNNAAYAALLQQRKAMAVLAGDLDAMSAMIRKRLEEVSLGKAGEGAVANGH